MSWTLFVLSTKLERSVSGFFFSLTVLGNTSHTFFLFMKYDFAVAEDDDLLTDVSIRKYLVALEAVRPLGHFYLLQTVRRRHTRMQVRSTHCTDRHAVALLIGTLHLSPVLLVAYSEVVSTIFLSSHRQHYCTVLAISFFFTRSELDCSLLHGPKSNKARPS